MSPTAGFMWLVSAIVDHVPKAIIVTASSRGEAIDAWSAYLGDWRNIRQCSVERLS